MHPEHPVAVPVPGVDQGSMPPRTTQSISTTSDHVLLTTCPHSQMSCISLSQIGRTFRSIISLLKVAMPADRAREGLNSANPIDGSKSSSAHQLKSLRRDRDLSLPDILQAARTLMELMTQYNWGSSCVRMFLEFFDGLETQPRIAMRPVLTLLVRRLLLFTKSVFANASTMTSTSAMEGAPTASERLIKQR